MTTSLFTFLLEYRGGTYLRQLVADNHLQALDRWTECLDETRMRDNHKQELRAEIEVWPDIWFDPVAVKDLQSVWYTGITANGDLAQLTIVKTA